MPLPDNLLWDEYLNKVVSHVKFKYDRKEIKWELEEHMEDMYDDFISDGMNEEDAKKAVIDCMGDADEIGKERPPAGAGGRLWSNHDNAGIVVKACSVRFCGGAGNICTAYIFPVDRYAVSIRVYFNPDQGWILYDPRHGGARPQLCDGIFIQGKTDA